MWRWSRSDVPVRPLRALQGGGFGMSNNALAAVFLICVAAIVAIGIVSCTVTNVMA